MDKCTDIYSQIISVTTDHLRKKNPDLLESTLKKVLKKLDKQGISYKTKDARICITRVPDDDNRLLYNTTLSLVAPFEEKYGISETWRELRNHIILAIKNVRQPIRMLNVEVPISAYLMTYAHFENLIAVNASGFRKISWINGVATVTNHRILFQDGKNLDEIPLQSIATIGREIYLVYTGKTAKGIIKAIDYKNAERVGMSCSLVLARQDVMGDFVNTSRVMRQEYRRLNLSESRVIVALYNEAMTRELGQVCKVSDNQVSTAFNRLLKLKYIDKKGHLTALGINAAIEVLEREKLSRVCSFEKVEKDESKRIYSREL